jgi:hypothetical protein
MEVAAADTEVGSVVHDIDLVHEITAGNTPDDGEVRVMMAEAHKQGV